VTALRAALALAFATAAAGCVYFNGLYNAERAYAEADRARLAGQDSIARAGYERAAAGAERSYEKDREGKWADDALYLLGRARLRGGDWEGARDALEQARVRGADSEVTLGATLYLGALGLATGDPAGVTLLDRVLVGLGSGPVRGEGHLWRARYLLARGLTDLGWADLERARIEDPNLRVPAALEWLTSGVLEGDPAHSREGLDALLVHPRGAERVDTIAALAESESARRGPAAGALLLAGADTAAWIPARRDRLILLRAQLHLRAQDTAAARADAVRVVLAGGERATEGRLWLARLALDGMRRVEELEGLRPLLLPAVDEPAVRSLLEQARQLEMLAERGPQASPLGMFAAAEVARDALAAPRLAEALFVEYAGTTPPQPWRGKALLAAAAVAVDPERWALLRHAATSLPGDPYVAVAMGIPGDPRGYEILERELRDELRTLLADVTAAVRERDMLVRPRAEAAAERPR